MPQYSPLSRRRFLELSAAGAVAAATPGGRAKPVPSGLLTDLLPKGLGVEDARQRLSWQVADLGTDTRQTHYRIQVADSPQRLTGGPWVWDSGRVASADSVAVPYGGPALAPRSPYWWRVQTFDGARASGWSQPAMLATGVRGDWAGEPIWTPAADSPADGTFAVRVTIQQVSAGLWFRATSPSENYLWQVFAGSPGRLRAHVFTGGSFRVLGDRALPVDVPLGSPVDIEIEMRGATFVTSVNGAQADTTTDGTHERGTVGLRNGSTEAQSYDSARFTGADGTVLLDDDFATDRGTFGAGTVSGGALRLTGGQSGLASALGPDDSWALLRREFTLPRAPVAAGLLHVAALSPDAARQYVAKVWCNGEVAAFASVRAPAGEPRYQSFDVTHLLRPGAGNALAALCYATADQRFLAQLDVVFADGRRQTIATGTDWRARRQAGLLPDRGDIGGGFYHAPQEYWDLRAEPAGWTSPGFDDTPWQPALTRDAIAGLRPALIEPVEVTDVTQVSVKKLGAGHWLVDLGAEIAGGLALDVEGRAGQTVEVRLGEELNDDGTVRFQLRAGNTYREVWTLRDGRQRIEHWGYRGFRHAELICDPELALDAPGAVTGRAHRVAWRDDDSAFTSSDARLDRVYEFCRYSIKATRGDLYQDTPTRERGPYEGDAYINQRSEYAVQRSYALARYSDYYLSRTPTWPTEYHLMSVLSAWHDYLHTGDPGQLASDYDLFVAKNLTGFIESDDLVHKAPGTSSQNLADLVDWPPANRDGYVFTEVNTVVNAFQYAAFDALAKVADALGKSADAVSWRDRADRSAAAIRAKLLDTGRFRDGLGTDHSAQQATAFPVALGLAPADQLGGLGDTLAAGGMKVSVYGAQFLLDALFTAGRADAAIALMTSAQTNSWQHMLDDLHATIVAEAWDPAIKPNTTFSHAWASSPAGAIARYVLGVQVTAPGAAAVDVRPRTGRLTRAAGRVPTIRGPVEVAVDKSGGGYRLDVDVPPNTTARVIVELAGDRPERYRVTGAHASAARALGGDVTGTLLVVGPVGSGRTTVIREGSS